MPHTTKAQAKTPILQPARDNAELCRALSSALATLGFDVVAVPREEDVLGEFEKRDPDAVLLDSNMPGVMGETCRRIRRKAPFLPILMLTARDPDFRAAARPIVIREIELDPYRMSVRKNGVIVSLAHREFELLHYLMKRPGKPVAYQALIEKIWGAPSGKRREHLRRIVCLLRKKLEHDATAPQYLLTETGFGFRFCEDAPSDGGKDEANL